MGSELIERIAAGSTLKRRNVAIPEWGEGPFFVRELTAGEAEDFLKLQEDGSDPMGVRVWLVARVVTNGDGRRLFDDAAAETLRQASNTVIDRICREAMHVSGMSDESQAVLEKNSDSTR